MWLNRSTWAVSHSWVILCIRKRNFRHAYRAYFCINQKMPGCFVGGNEVYWHTKDLTQARSLFQTSKKESTFAVDLSKPFSGKTVVTYEDLEPFLKEVFKWMHVLHWRAQTASFSLNRPGEKEMYNELRICSILSFKTDQKLFLQVPQFEIEISEVS